jgi:hypothetical protein
MAEMNEVLINEDGTESEATLTVSSIEGQYACRFVISSGGLHLANVLVTRDELRALMREICPAAIRYARELTVGFDIHTDMFAFHYNMGSRRVKGLLTSPRFEEMIGDVVFSEATQYK